METRIEKVNGRLVIQVNGEELPPVAYMSYLEDNADYEGFKKAGYKLYCACVYMGDGTINELHGLRAMGDHVWKSRKHYDFTPIKRSVEKIVGDNKERVYVMLRVNLNVPKWWREENPDELLVLSDGVKGPFMQSIFSKKWHEDVKKFLAYVCAYVTGFDYAENVIAIQVAGMQTEEWLAFRNATGSFDFSTPAKNAYEEWCKKKYGEGFNAYLPTAEELYAARHGDKIIDKERHRNAIDYIHFFNEGFTSTIKEFCAYAKEYSRRKRLVGVFYGYFGQLPCDFGHNGFSPLLEDENIDFFASPFAYISARQTAEDWIYHGVMDSCTLAGKAWFLEADVRTYLTKALYETNPELMASERTVKHFSYPTWFGPKTEEETIWVLLRSFAKALCSGNAFWWFDMWGQWYNAPAIMDFMRRCRVLYEKEYGKPKRNDLAVIMDEEASYGVSEEYYDELSRQQLIELGFVGAAYDMYQKSDEPKIKDKYKVLLYLAKDGANELAYAGECIRKEGMFTAQEVSSVLQKAGGQVFSEGNIVYANDRFVCVTAAQAGEVKLTMPKACKLRGFLDGKIYEGKEFVFTFAYNQSELFEVIE